MLVSMGKNCDTCFSFVDIQSRTSVLLHVDDTLHRSPPLVFRIGSKIGFERMSVSGVSILSALSLSFFNSRFFSFSLFLRLFRELSLSRVVGAQG